jgi:hypothetical protein
MRAAQSPGPVDDREHEPRYLKPDERQGAIGNLGGVRDNIKSFDQVGPASDVTDDIGQFRYAAVGEVQSPESTC